MPYYMVRALAAPILINNSSGYLVMIAGQPVTVVAGSLSIQCAVGRRSTASFTIYSASLATHLQQYQQVQIYDTNSYLIFSGYVSTPKEVKPGFQSSLLTSVTCIDQHFLADKRIVAAAYANNTPQQIAANIVTTFLASEGVTIGQIYDPNPQVFFSLTTLVSTTFFLTQSSSSIPNAVFGYCTAAAAFDALVQAASSSGIPYYWQIDQLKRFYMLPYTFVPGPSIDGTQIDQKNNAPSVTRANPAYRNTQYVIGGKAQTSTQVETRIGDGNTVAWPMAFNISMVLTVLLNGAPKTVGIKGVETGKDFYWNKGDPNITQDASGTKLAPFDTLTVSYIGEYPTVVVTNNSAQVSYEQGLDGTSGIFEEVEQDATITTLAGGFAEASNLLTRYAQQCMQLQCVTRQTGFVQGQSCTVNLPMFGISNLAMLLESVTYTDSIDSINIWSQLSLVVGPYDTTWESFFGKLIGNGQQPLTDLNVGTSQSLALLAPFSASLAPTATLTATVTACALFSTSTLVSTTLIVC